jgi:(p)ppGpp synthase/HD superfamily hydrolase
MNGLAIMNLAHAIAVVAHDGQSRKGAGEPYINHVERVANSVYGWKAKSVSYLHDVVEDTHLTFDSLSLIGIPSDPIIWRVARLTRNEDETYTEFIDRIIESDDEIVLKVKIADIEDNLSDLDTTEFWSMRKRYMKALLRLQEALEGE